MRTKKRRDGEEGEKGRGKRRLPAGRSTIRPTKKCFVISSFLAFLLNLHNCRDHLDNLFKIRVVRGPL